VKSSAGRSRKDVRAASRRAIGDDRPRQPAGEGSIRGRAIDARTEIACVQNALNLIERAALPLMERCRSGGTPFVPFFPLGSAFDARKRVLEHPAVRATAERLGALPSQVAIAWLGALAPNILLIPGTSSVEHLEENLAAADLVLDDEVLASLGDAS